MDPETTQVPPKSSRSWLSSLIALLVLLIFIASTGYLYIQNQQLKKQIEALSENLAPTPLPTPESINEDMADWKTYTNETLGFSFRYPPIYKVDERDPKGFLLISTTDETNKESVSGGISIDARLLGSYTNYQKAVESIYKALTVSNDKMLGAWTIYQGVGKDGMLKGVEFRQAITQYKTGVIEVEVIATSDYTVYFDQILATFKFIKPATTTYTCPSTGWVDCMPGPDAKPECSTEAMTWYKANCPNFQGGAL